MSFIFSSLDRKADEGQVQFDNRISDMLPVPAGRAYFDIRNYEHYSGEFNVYVEWDNELMDKLYYSLPSGGYYVKATIKQAHELHDLKIGLPVYMKLVSREGKIYPYRTYTIAFGRPYSIEFGGGVLIPFEDRYEELGCAAVKNKKHIAGGSRVRGIAGSYAGGSHKVGLYGSRRSGSQRGFLSGGSQQGFLSSSSQRGFYSGSQRHEHEYEYEYLYRYFMGGSQRGFLSGGSQRGIYSGSQRHEHEYEYEYLYRYFMSGSQRWFLSGGSQRGFYSGGSQRGYLTGSQIKMYLTGSQYGFLFGSRRGISGSQMYIVPEVFKSHIGIQSRDNEQIMEYQPAEDWSYIPTEWQLINKYRRPAEKKGGNARLGYGIDLI
ncbi:MAG: hypothetical protein ACI4EF_05385 [Coprococcus sp.]